MEGYVTVSRRIADSPLMREPVTFSVFMYLLLCANYRDGECSGIVIKRGEAVTSYPRIALGVGITERQARTALQKLVKSGWVTVRRYSKFSVVTISDFESYQGVSKKSQSNDSENVRDMSPSKEINNNKEFNNSRSSCTAAQRENIIYDFEPMEIYENEEEELYGWGKNRNVMLTEIQVERLLDMLSLTEFDLYIDKLDRFISEKKANVHNHYKTILRWVQEDRQI